MYSIRGKVFVISGSSRGIGKSIALEAARRGARGIIVNYVEGEAEARETANLIERIGSKAVIVKGDVGLWSDAQRIARTA